MNAHFPEIIRAIGNQEIELDDVTWAVQAVNDSATFDRDATHLDDYTAELLGTKHTLPGVTWAKTATGLELATTALSAGTAVDVDSLSPADPVGALLVFVDTGTAGTSTLAGWIDRRADSAAVAGTSDGASVLLYWPPAGVFLRIPG